MRHLHAFAREVRLTEPEWEKAVEFVVGLGQRTNDTHNEVVLCSDAVGFSTLVCLLNNGNAGNTETGRPPARSISAREIGLRLAERDAERAYSVMAAGEYEKPAHPHPRSRNR